jgi:hypothetical protein
MSNGNFGIQIVKKIVLGAATSVGVLSPFVITSLVVKRRIRRTFNEMPKKADDFFTRLMKESKNVEPSAVADEIIQHSKNVFVRSDEPTEKNGATQHLFVGRAPAEKARSLKKQGMRNAEIAEQMGIDELSVHTLLNGSDKIAEETE